MCLQNSNVTYGRDPGRRKKSGQIIGKNHVIAGQRYLPCILILLSMKYLSNEAVLKDYGINIPDPELS